MLRITSKVASLKCVSRAFLFAIPFESRVVRSSEVGINNTVLLKSMLLTVNRYGSILLEVRVKTERSKMLTVARGVDVVGLGTRYQPEEEVTIIGFQNVEEAGDWKSSSGGLVWIPCDGQVGVLEGV